MEFSRALPKLLNSCRAERLVSENMPNLALQRAVIGFYLRLQRGDDLVVDVPDRLRSPQAALLDEGNTIAY